MRAKIFSLTQCCVSHVSGVGLLQMCNLTVFISEIKTFEMVCSTYKINKLSRTTCTVNSSKKFKQIMIHYESWKKVFQKYPLKKQKQVCHPEFLAFFTEIKNSFGIFPFCTILKFVKKIAKSTFFP